MVTSPGYFVPKLIVDAHQDLAWNMQTFDRDYTRSAAETRRLEAGGLTPERNGDTLLGWSDYQRGRVALIFASLYAAPTRLNLHEWDKVCYADIQEAHRVYSAQADLYERLAEEHSDKFRLVHSRADLENVLAPWVEDKGSAPGEPGDGDENQEARGRPVGLVMLMEGAEGVRQPGELEEWWERGLRIIGPAWKGTRFCGGTNEPGPLTSEGFALLERMADFGFGLDLSHMDEQSVLQALDFYPGEIIASHAPPASLLPENTTNRFLSDRVVQGILERDGVIGLGALNGFLKIGWRNSGSREDVHIDLLVAQIDYICQMAGDAGHAGLGSDFDGGYGLQSVPIEFDTIADLQKLVPLLANKGYSDEDIEAVLGKNWLRRLQRILP
jgi:membrane dipeptidase